VRRTREPVFASVRTTPVRADLARVYFYRAFEPYESLARPLIYLNGTPLAPSEPGAASFRDIDPGALPLAARQLHPQVRVQHPPGRQHRRRDRPAVARMTAAGLEDPNRVAADRGYAPAQAYVGYFYKHGQGVAKDYGQAAQWYRKAAEQGFANAQTDLALMYLDGLGVPKDQNEARKWLHLAAAQGNGQALNVLAALDRGGPPKARLEPAMDAFEQGKKLYMAGDKAGAVRPFLAAAQAGNSQAQIQIGYQYEYGEGVPQNYVLAAQWYARAANLGAPAAD